MPTNSVAEDVTIEIGEAIESAQELAASRFGGLSDKLLNDFMAVVYRQRTMPPEEIDIERTLADLLRSDVVSKWLVDEKGVPLLKEEDLRGVAKSVSGPRGAAPSPWRLRTTVLSCASLIMFSS